MEEPVVRRLIAVVVALPAIVLGASTAAMLGRAVPGAHPVWREEPVNLTEAAALRDQATVVRMIRRGEDPYRRRELRADLVFSEKMELTPLEAAIATQRAEIVEIILWSAPPPGAGVWNRARCLASLEGDGGSGEVLDRYRPESAVLDCRGIERPWK